VALIRWGTTGRQQTLVGTLTDIAAKVEAAGFKAPAVAIIGDVVKLRESLNWFETRPLFGRRIVVTRTRKQAGALSSRLRELGADVFEIPTIRIEPPEDKLAMAEMVRDAHGYDWLVFTSPNGVDAFFEAFYKIYKDARDIVDLQPQEFVAEAVVKEFQKEGSVENLRILIARAQEARDVLPEQLTKLGAIVDVVAVYQTVPETEDRSGAVARFREEGADMVTFTSSSTAENFMALKLPLPPGLKTASIGPITSATMRGLGLSVDVEAARYDIPGLVEAILAQYTAES
jgi:uroporphyrinogen III methyltransferase/synthase